MFELIISYFKKLVRRNKDMKTLNLKKEVKLNKTSEEWELLCDACSSIAEKAGWTEKDSEKLIKNVRKELRG